MISITDLLLLDILDRYFRYYGIEGTETIIKELYAPQSAIQYKLLAMYYKVIGKEGELG